MIFIKKTEKFGRGLYASKLIKKGTTIEISPCLTWEPDDERLIQDSVLRFYVFDDKAKSSCLALGLGSLFNHSLMDANVGYRYNKMQKRMFFTTKKDVKAGEQLFINYGYDPVKVRRAWELQRIKSKDEKVKEPFWDEDIKKVSLWDKFKRLFQ